MQTQCVAWQTGKVNELPIKSKVLVKKERFFCYAVFNAGPDVFVRKRAEKDIWRGLFEFPALEGLTLSDLPDGNEALTQWLKEQFFPVGDAPDFSVAQVSKPYRQTLTHRQVTAVFIEINLPAVLPEKIGTLAPFAGTLRLPRTDLKKNIAVPRLIDWYLQDKAGTLSLF